MVHTRGSIGIRRVGPVLRALSPLPTGKVSQACHSLSKCPSAFRGSPPRPHAQDDLGGLSGGARVWEDNLPLLCNHGLGWSPQPHQPPGDKAHAWARDQNPMGGLGWCRVGREIRAEATGDQVAPRVGNKMAPATRAANKGSQTRCCGRVPSLWGNMSSPKDQKPVLWELGSQGWVFRVFCNYFPFVLP